LENQTTTYAEANLASKGGSVAKSRNSSMKGRYRVSLLILLLSGVGGYLYFSPFISLYKLYRAVSEHNTREIEAGIDFHSLRENIRPQVKAKVNKELEKSLGGQNFISSGLAGLGMAVANPLVDQKVDEAISPGGLQALLTALEQANNKTNLQNTPSPQGLQPAITSTIQELKSLKFGYENINQFQMQLQDPSSNQPIGVSMQRQNLLDWKVVAVQLP